MTETKKQNVLSILTVASFVVAIFMFLFNVIGIKISAIAKTDTSFYEFINISGLQYLVEQSVKVGSTFKGISVLYDCMKYEAFFTVLSDIVFFVAIVLPVAWLLLKKMVSEKSQKKLNIIVISVSFGIVVLYSLFAFILVGKYSSVLNDTYAFEELTGYTTLTSVKFNLSTYVYIPLIISVLLFTAYLIIFFVKGEGVDKLSVKEKICSYKTLLDNKIISQEEFTSLKAKAIDNLVVKASNFEKDLLDYKTMLDENVIDIDDFAKIKSRYL